LAMLKRQRSALALVGLASLAAVAQLPRASGSAAATSRPNVLIIVTDDQREGFRVMPQARRWLKKGGTYFDNAFVTTPLCCPSRASIFTGRYTHNHHVTSNDGEDANLAQQSTLQYYLQRAGYETALFGKYLNAWDITQAPPYFDRYALTVRSHFYSFGTWNVNGTVKTIPDYNTVYIGRKARRFLHGAGERKQPWFLYLATAAPHGPFIPEAKYADARVPHWRGDPAVFERDRSDKPNYVQRSHGRLTYGRATRNAQFRTLMSVDDMVARVFKTLNNLGELNNTLVVFISDNGLMWGEHGLKGKGVPYDQAIKVPMLARWPGHFLPHTTDSRIAANIDIAPTVLEAAGIAPDSQYPIDGRSLLGTSSHRRRLLTEHFPPGNHPPGNWDWWASTRTKTYKYTEYYEPDSTTVKFREYYDLASDPWELNNLLGDSDPSNDPNVATLSQRLAQERTCVGTTSPTACP
jgi:arylsulfatase A-like enzyme